MAAPLADRHDGAQPRVGGLIVTLTTHLLHHLASFRGRFIAVTLNEEMRRSGNVE
jgi:hypothetical protein